MIFAEPCCRAPYLADGKGSPPGNQGTSAGTRLPSRPIDHSLIEVRCDGAAAGSVQARALEADSVDLSLGGYLTAPVGEWSTAYDNLTLDLD